MTKLETPAVLIRHLYRVWRAGQLRFRLETFGAYYPSTAYQRSPWQVSPSVIWLLMQRSASYSRWVVEMERIRREGPSGWWDRYREPLGPS